MRAVQYIRLVEGQFSYENGTDDEGNPIVIESPVFEIVGDNFEYYVKSVYGVVDNLSFESETNMAKATFIDSSNSSREVFFEFVQDTEHLPDDLVYLNDTPEYEYPPEYTADGTQPQKWSNEEEYVQEPQPDSGDNEDPVVPVEELPADIPGDYPGNLITDPLPFGPEVLPGDPTEESSSDDMNTWNEDYFGDPEDDPDYGYETKSDGDPDVPDAPVDNFGTVWPITSSADARYYPETSVELHNLIYEEYSWQLNGKARIGNALYPYTQADDYQATVDSQASLVSKPFDYDPTQYYRFEYDVEFGPTSTGTPTLIVDVISIKDDGTIDTSKTFNLSTWNKPGALVPESGYNVPWSILKNLANPYEDFPVSPITGTERAGVLPNNQVFPTKRIALNFRSTGITTLIRGFRVFSNTGPLAV